MRKTKEAFLWILGILKKYKISFEITGGLAARVYGSKRKLADIDIDLNEKDYKKIIKEIRPFIIFGPGRYKDKYWNLELITLKYKGQDIDLSLIRSGKIFDSKKKKWILLVNSFHNPSLKKIYGIQVPVQNKKELISYKKILGRKVDLEDLNFL